MRPEFVPCLSSPTYNKHTETHADKEVRDWCTGTTLQKGTLTVRPDHRKLIKEEKKQNQDICFDHEVATVLVSIPASSESVKSEDQHMKQFWQKVFDLLSSLLKKVPLIIKKQSPFKDFVANPYSYMCSSWVHVNKHDRGLGRLRQVTKIPTEVPPQLLGRGYSGEEGVQYSV